MTATVGSSDAWAVLIAFGLCRMNFSQPRDFIVSLATVCMAVVVAKSPSV
jgi:hypothetical protein